MIFNWITHIREILFSPYGKYMACAGLLIACTGYDEYRMKQIGNTMAAKYTPNEPIMIIANNKFMCPFTKIDIYKVNGRQCSLTGKNNTLNKEKPLEKKYTVCTGLQAQCNATASTQNSRPPEVGLEFNVGGIATELFLTMPPLIELGTEVFICDAGKCIKVSKII